MAAGMHGRSVNGNCTTMEVVISVGEQPQYQKMDSHVTLLSNRTRIAARAPPRGTYDINTSVAAQHEVFGTHNCLEYQEREHSPVPPRERPYPDEENPLSQDFRFRRLADKLSEALHSETTTQRAEETMFRVNATLQSSGLSPSGKSTARYSVWSREGWGKTVLTCQYEAQMADHVIAQDKE